MSTPVKLSLFGVGIVVVFAVAYVVGAALIPSDVVDAWMHRGAGH